MSNIWFRFVVVAFCLLWIGKVLLLPSVAYLYYKDDFIELSSRCGTAMDETWFLAQQKDGLLNKTGDVHLMVCHDYDKLRKKLLILGVSESVLAYLGLEALELQQKSVSDIVEPHRFLER